MEEGYQPDGWLGMLMGTRLWYPLYGATLASDAAFEDRMLALAREIGSRGRASGVAAETSAVTAVPAEAAASVPASDVDRLRAELVALRIKDLRSRAKASGASARQLEVAADADDPKAAVVELVLSLRPSADRRK
jgi:hypothetical protein